MASPVGVYKCSHNYYARNGVQVSDDLQSKMDELKAMLEEFQNNMKPLEDQKDSMKSDEQKAYQAYQAEVAKIRANRKVIDDAIFEAKKEANKIQADIWRVEQDIKAKKAAAEAKELAKKQAEVEAQKKQSLQVLHEKWDTLTMGAPWREWAKDHQIEGGHNIVRNRKVILADPMGLGKTLTSAITCDMVEQATKFASETFPFLGDEVQEYSWEQQGYVTKIVNSVTKPCGLKILYFCPATMIQNVKEEFERWSPHRTVVWIAGFSKAERSLFLNTILAQHNEYVVICNYEAWRRDKSLLESIIGLDFDTVIVDESHNVKNMKSSAYLGIKKIIDQMNPPYVIPMTGTPILNRPQELFSQLSLVNPTKFRDLNQFLWDYCEQDDEGYWGFKPGGIERISKTIGDNFLRRTREMAGIKLPPKTVTIHRLEVDTKQWPEQARVREQMRKYYTIKLKEEGKAIAAAAMIAVYTRLRQIETWPAGIEVSHRDPITKEKIIDSKVEVEESQKVDYIISKNEDDGTWDGIIPEVVEDERVVLFSQFKAPLREIKTRIERMGKRAIILDGDTPKDVQQEVRHDFDIFHTPDRSKSKWDVALCNYKVGGVGLNLTSATQMIILDEEWNPGKRDQAYDRIHRMGQEKPVTIHVIRNEKTIDDWLAHIIEKKEDIVNGFNQGMVPVDDFIKFLDDEMGGLI